MIKVGSWAMSEPLYLALGLAGFLLLVAYFERVRWRWLVASAVAFGLAYLTRYVGLSLVAAGLVAVLVRYKVPWPRRLKETAIYLLFSLVPMLVFMARNYALTGYTTNRQITWHPAPFGQIRNGLELILGWFIPPDWLARLGIKPFVAGLILMILVILWLERRRFPDIRVNLGTRPGLEALALVYLVLYLGQVLISLFLLDHSTPLDNRILSPVLLCVLVLLIPVLARSWQSGSLLGRGLIAAVCVAFLAYFIPGAINQVQQLQQDGQGFSSDKWKHSELIQVVGALPPDVVVFSNISSPLWLWTGKTSYTLPSFYDPVTSQIRSSYPSDLEKMRQAIQQGNGVLAIFEPEMLDPQYYSLADLTQGLTPSQEFRDGVMYK
jgi:hypothetical protein